MKKFIMMLLFFLIPCTIYASSDTTPMKKATLVWWPGKKNDLKTHTVLQSLREKLAIKGYDLKTQHEHPPQKSDLVLVAYPYYTVPKGMADKSFLWLLESPLSISIPANKETEQRYKKIFTYNQEVAKRQKYVRLPIYYAYPDFTFTPANLVKKKVLVAQVAGNHYNKKTKSNYFQRRLDTAWFLKYHPNDILLAGRGQWDIFRNSLAAETRSAFDARYKGSIDDKIQFLSNASFGLAYENTKAPDYVTEKIFDVMAAGTVPIYSGAPNIEEYVPKACFINRDDFKTPYDLYIFLTRMSGKKYLSYINCIIQYMSHPETHINTHTRVLDKLVDEMLTNHPQQR